MSPILLEIVVVLALVVLMAGGFTAVLAKAYRRVSAGTALVLTSARGIRVRRSGAVVMPFVSTAELIDLTAKLMRIERRGRDALGTSDGARFDVNLCVTVRVGDTSDDIAHVARTLGCRTASDSAALDRHFGPKMTSVLIDVVGHLSSEELLRERAHVEDKLTEALEDAFGRGFVIDQVALEQIEPAPADTAGPFR